MLHTIDILNFRYSLDLIEQFDEKNSLSLLGYEVK